jgi:Clp amino terminal domain, pathogenicity island component
MFERFTDRARRVVVLAQEEGRRLNHGHIGTEHILLGLLREGEGIAATALQSLGVSLEAARNSVERITGRGTTLESGHIPFSPRAKKVLELSLREALQLGHNYIGTEHILLGLIREGQGLAAQIMVQLGADLPRLREQTLSILSGHEGTEAAPHPRFIPRSGPVLINPGVVLAGPPPELRQVIALGQPTQMRDGTTLTPISLTIWSSFVELRYASIAARGQPPFVHLDDWSVEDDRGTKYDYTGAATSSHDRLLLGTICFAPPPPRDATHLSLLGPAGARLDIDLPTPPADRDVDPSAEPAQPEHADPDVDDQPDEPGAEGK